MKKPSVVAVVVKVYRSESRESGMKPVETVSCNTHEELLDVIEKYSFPPMYYSFETAAGFPLESVELAGKLLQSGRPVMEERALIPGRKYMVIKPEGIFATTPNDVEIKLPTGFELRYKSTGPDGNFIFQLEDILPYPEKVYLDHDQLQEIAEVPEW